jgi:two-component system sensor histidine kinase VicK
LLDVDQFTRVVDNLISNAIRYTPQGGSIEISSAHKELDGEHWATVRVMDTGMGIPAEELPHIFERFFRGAEPQQLQIQGTGLGLAIAKEIVELHGGRMAVESQPNVGTSVTVCLPAVD